MNSTPAYMPTRTRIMTVLNVTPDSFSDGGKFQSERALLQAAEVALAAGSHVLDIGGESTRPGAQTIPADEELKRLLPAIQAILKEFPDACLSVDTRKASVAQAVLGEGVRIINDVSGFQYDPAMARVCAQAHCQVILMHSQGTPETMQQDPQYPDGVIATIYQFFERQIALAEAAGIRRELLVLDPGFGFGKALAHNLTLLKHLDRFQSFNLPLLVGTSRKSFLTLGATALPPQEREGLTAASLALAIERGAQWVRIHDPLQQIPVVRLVEATLEA